MKEVKSAESSFLKIHLYCGYVKCCGTSMKVISCYLFCHREGRFPYQPLVFLLFPEVNKLFLLPRNLKTKNFTADFYKPPVLV